MWRTGFALVPFARHAYSVRHLVQLVWRVREHVAHPHMAESVDGLVDVDQVSYYNGVPMDFAAVSRQH
jgi:hypothetical protein